MEKLFLGFNNEEAITLNLSAVQRHIACFGASGSGKTVACKVLSEELALQGVPMIIFDPQGDIASLINPETDDSLLAEKGLNPDVRNVFAEKTEVVIWTPGSSKGLPLSINPLQFDETDELDAEDRLRFLSATAKNVVELIGYDSDNDDGKAAESVLATVFDYCFQKKIRLDGFGSLIDLLSDLPESVNELILSISSPKAMTDLLRKLRFLTIGSRKLIFETGYPANIDALLGLGEHDTGKTRVSIIYLNTLSSQEEKEFFMSNITQMLYAWMLRNPLQSGQDGLQAVLYIDEIAPFLPPVKMPSCKESLMLLFKQARKYGVGCLIATQNPGDIDYKSIAQISTYLIGSLKTKQDLGKIETRIESMAPQTAGEIMQTIPALKKGHFLLLSPDQEQKLSKLSVRWLFTKHDVISEEQLPGLVSDELRQRYANAPTPKSKTKAVPAPEQRIEEVSRPLKQEPPIVENADEKVESGDLVLLAAYKIFERDLKKVCAPYMLASALKLFKKEILVSAAFEYLPLVKAELKFFDRKGLFKKTTEEIPANLYLDYKSGEIMQISGKEIQFHALVDLDPHKIEDLDERVVLETKSRDEVDYDFRKLGKKMDKEEITTLLQHKYNVEVLDVSLVLYPTWQCRLENKEQKTLRTIQIDAVNGLQIVHD